jgi:hypothetical protein
MREIEADAKIYHQQPIIAVRRDVTKYKTAFAENRSVRGTFDTAAEDRVCTTQGKQVGMELHNLRKPLLFGGIKTRFQKGVGIFRIDGG